jgi:hypothetical protein
VRLVKFVDDIVVCSCVELCNEKDVVFTEVVVKLQ